MNAITLAQPYATLAAHGFKRADGRRWRTACRGPIAIYAARWRAGLDCRAFKSLCFSEPFREPIYHALHVPRCLELPRGAIVGVAELVEVERIEEEADMPRYPEREFGVYSPLRYIWRLENSRALAAPIPVNLGCARSGLWQLPRPLRTAVKLMLESEVAA